MVKFGDTHVLVTASLEEKAPPFLKGSGKGWVGACLGGDGGGCWVHNSGAGCGGDGGGGGGCWGAGRVGGSTMLTSLGTGVGGASEGARSRPGQGGDKGHRRGRGTYLPPNPI